MKNVIIENIEISDSFRLGRNRISYQTKFCDVQVICRI